jgi:hypothetical protein
MLELEGAKIAGQELVVGITKAESQARLNNGREKIRALQRGLVCQERKGVDTQKELEAVRDPEAP